MKDLDVVMTIGKQRQGQGILIFLTILKNKVSSDIMHIYYINIHFYTSNTNSVTAFIIIVYLI